MSLGSYYLKCIEIMKQMMAQCLRVWNGPGRRTGGSADDMNSARQTTDHESSSDPSTGGASATPDHTDLASGSTTGAPGVYATPFYGYYNGGTTYDPNDPATYQDDYIMFRIRLAGDPSSASGDDLRSAHWNILIDVDADGYKEFWVDINGPHSRGR